MRRSVLGSVALLGVFLAGCEDGPNQPYSPAGAGFAGNSNNAGPDAGYNDPGTQAYDAGGGGTNSVNICTAAQQNVQWSKAFEAPLIPPFGVGGIDLSAGGTFANVTIEDVLHGTNGQAQLCQGSSVACSDGTGFPSYAWGPSQQLQACYDPASHNLTFFLMLPGYDGKATFTLPKLYNGQPVPLAIDPTSGQPADLNFVWQMGQPITVNGQVLKGKNGGALWSSNGIDDQAANQMYLGMMYTFQPTLIAVTNPTTTPPLTEMTDPTADCLSVAKCRTSANADSSGGNFGVRAAGIYFDAANSQSNDAATAASPSDMYMYPVKFEPYSLAPYNEGLDTFLSPIADPNLLFNGAPIYGPYSPAGVLSKPGAATQTPFCTLFMGGTWGDFVKNCVNVSGDPKIDQTSMAKLLSAQHHTAEWFQFSVVGINQNFSADKAELTDSNGQPTVLQDTVSTPNNDDVSTDFYVDVRSSGPKLNDQRGDTYPPPAATAGSLGDWENTYLAGQDLHGTAAVMGYYRQLVLNGLQAQLVASGITPVANPEQCWFTPTPAELANSTLLTKALQAWIAPKGCTGFEQMLTPASPTGAAVWSDSLDVTPQGYPYAAPPYNITAYVPRSIFQPGDPELHFMADPVDAVGFDNNTTAPNLLQASLSQVVAIMGHGNVAAIPPAAQDWRFYLQYWAQAYTKYLLNRSSNPTWQALYNNTCTATGCRQVNQDNLFFDLNNGIDKFEYVDRTAATTLGAPVDFEYDILINTSNTQNNNFYQRLSRAENALYQSMLVNKTATPGSNDNVFLSDLFGSPAIVNYFIANGIWGGSADGTVSVWQCLTTNNAACTTTPPTDSNGVLLVDGQGQPLFTNYQGIFTGTAFSIGSTLPITSTMPFIASAIVDLPNYANPYDTTSTNTPISVLVPWLPSQPGTGFDIPINGQRTQFVQTGALDFSGVTITTNIDYLPTYDSTSGALNGGTIAAVETQDFLGEVFPCVDPATGDILRTKMYSSTLDVVTWLEQHPGAQAACNIYIRYSPYDNYVDYITSLANGVLLSVNPGAGGGTSRIGDATLFNPALLTQTQ